MSTCVCVCFPCLSPLFYPIRSIFHLLFCFVVLHLEEKFSFSHDYTSPPRILFLLSILSLRTSQRRLRKTSYDRLVSLLVNTQQTTHLTTLPQTTTKRTVEQRRLGKQKQKKYSPDQYSLFFTKESMSTYQMYPNHSTLSGSSLVPLCTLCDQHSIRPQANAI